MPLLNIDNLTIRFGKQADAVPVVDRLSLQCDAGELISIVGESGSGKSLSMLALLGLVDAPGQVSADALEFNGQDLRQLSSQAKRRVLGQDIGIIFQDALASLNPSHTIGDQITETLRTHTSLRGEAIRQRALDLLNMVEIADASRILRAYPHQLSGGMNQRVMIALALSCKPKLLIADEPTTALDVTIQAQIIALLMRLQRELNMALILITHDLALVAEIAAKQVYVMYAGQVVEYGPASQVLTAPLHPYTRALLAAMPEQNRGQKHLTALPGIVPSVLDRPSSCLFAPRCAYVAERCLNQIPTSLAGTHQVRCFFPQQHDHPPALNSVDSHK